jgi:hypothetical protein
MMPIISESINKTNQKQTTFLASVSLLTAILLIDSTFQANEKLKGHKGI